MAYKNYSDGHIAEALVRLAVNKYDYDLTAEQTGISDRTLRRWDKDTTKKEIPELLERAIERMLMVIPENMKGSDWAIALGILMDKWLLVQGKATTRSENVLVNGLQELSNDEIADVLEEANRIIETAAGGASYPGGDKEEG